MSEDLVRLQRDAYTLVLGGIGGDSHSVGIISLHRMLQRAGYNVRYLSIQNSIASLVEAAEDADIVLVSNMDGHAQHYAAGLDSMRADSSDKALWYLGGNPLMDSSDEEATAELARLGFDRVFSAFVEPDELFEIIDSDLAQRQPVDRTIPDVGEREAAIRDRRAPVPAVLDLERDDVLSSWYTGQAAARKMRNAEVLEAGAHLADAQRRARAERRTLIQPRCGVSDVRDQGLIFEQLASAGADVLSFQIDSLTRNNLYPEIELLLKQAAADGLPADLNGFPLINHGVELARDLVQQHPSIPFQVRHSTRDPRLLAEISYAAGVSAYEGGPLCYNLPYYRDYHPADSMSAWSYVEQLTAEYYAAHGVKIDREYFGVLTATLVPPSIAISVTVLEALFSASYGVKSVSLGYAEQGHRVQDVTAIWATEDLAVEFLGAMGHDDVQVSTVFHQYMAAFPRDISTARTVLTGSARTAGTSGATRLMLKTFVESHHIPAAEQNAASLRLVRETLEATPRADRSDPLFQGEYERVTREARAIIGSVLDLDGPLPQQLTRAVLDGLIDIPFSPSVWAEGRIVSMRDETGAVRMAETANLAIPADLRRTHLAETSARLAKDGVTQEKAIELDVLTIGRGHFRAWPLDVAKAQA